MLEVRDPALGSAASLDEGAKTPAVLDVLALLAGAPLPRDGDRSHAEFFELGLDGCLAEATIGGDGLRRTSQSAP